jgi:hypothetical protein
VPLSPQCGRWTAFLGGGRLRRIGVHFWNGNATQMSSNDLGRTLRKLLAALRTFQHQFSPDVNRNCCTHAAALPPPWWDATNTACRRSLKGFHRANVGRYRPPVLHIHLKRVDTYPHYVATSLRIIVSREKNSVPESNDQPTYTFPPGARHARVTDQNCQTPTMCKITCSVEHM